VRQSGGERRKKMRSWEKCAHTPREEAFRTEETKEGKTKKWSECDNRESTQSRRRRKEARQQNPAMREEKRWKERRVRRTRGSGEEQAWGRVCKGMETGAVRLSREEGKRLPVEKRKS
jgi:hypothetical protein